MTGHTPPMDFDAGVAAVRAFLAREEQHLRERTAARRTELRALLPALVTLLREAGATQIWLFGSLAARSGWSPPHPESDLDLATTGLTPAALLAAEQRVRELTAEPVDLVRIEDAAPSLRERVLADGEPLP